MKSKSYFKSSLKTNRFNANQKVYIVNQFSNHFEIKYKFRNKGRYVFGVIDKYSKCVNKIINFKKIIKWI